MDTTLTKPLVSIMMLTYNRASFIDKAIKSVLEQTYSNWELIIIDDASTDTTQEVINSFNDPRIKYVRHKSNQGIPKSRNEALRHSSGKYVAILDSDDMWSLPIKLERQVEFLESHPEYALVGTQIELIDVDGNYVGKELYPEDDSSIRAGITYKNRFTHSSILFRKSTLLEVGGYDETLEVWEDYDLYLKLGKTYAFANLPINATLLRIHKTKISQGKQIERSRKIIEILNRYKGYYSSSWKGILRMYIKIIILHIFSEQFFASVKALQKKFIPTLGI